MSDILSGNELSTDMDEMLYRMECENFQALVTEFSEDCGCYFAGEVRENQTQLLPTDILEAKPLSAVPPLPEEEETLENSPAKKVDSRSRRRPHLLRGQWSPEEDRFLFLPLFLEPYMSISISLSFSLYIYLSLPLSFSFTLSLAIFLA